MSGGHKTSQHRTHKIFSCSFVENMKLLIIFPTINISLMSDIVFCVSPFTKSPSHSVLKGILMAVQGACATSITQLKGIGSAWDFETVKSPHLRNRTL